MASVTNQYDKLEQDNDTGISYELPDLTPEDVFGLLADCHRRTVLSYLEHKFNGQATVSELAAYACQHACAENSPADTTVTLHHSALPKLADAGLITYDIAEQRIQYIGHPLVEDCLELAAA